MEQSPLPQRETDLDFRLDEDWRVAEGLLPAGWMDKARELNAFRRARGIEDARALLRVMLIHLAEGCGLRETAVRASLAGLADVSDVALLKRLRSCGAWFEWMAQQLREKLQLRGEPAAAVPELFAGRTLKAVDGSVVTEPGATGSMWRLHYCIALPQLQCQQVHLGPREEGETLRRFEVSAGDILLADRGYAHPSGIAHVKRQAADVIVRINLVTLPLQEPGTGARLDVLACARTLHVGQARAWPAVVALKGKASDKPAEHIAGRLCIVRKTNEAASKARKRVQRESQRNGTQLQPQTLEAADYVLIFTTLGEEASAQQVMEAYRLRWQIELEFKRLKSLIELGHLKKHDEQSARSWLQGKLLVAMLITRLIAHSERVSPWGYEISWFQAPAELPVA